VPLNVLVSAANRHDSLFVEPILDSMPAIRIGGRGHPRRRPGKLHGDKGYDIPRVRRYLRRRGITARIARIGVDSGQRLGRHRWVVERTLGWLLSYKRLALRYDRTALTMTALARLAVILICARRLRAD
jgi:transposase